MFVKANRFLSKDSVKKEKGKIKQEIKANFITGPSAKEGRIYLRDGQLVESSGHDSSDDEKVKPKKQAKKGDESSDFEDVSSDEEI